MLWAWFRKRIGYHVCEEFTRWEVQEYQTKWVVARGGVVIGEPIVGRELYQERTCTICGKLEQSKLNA